MTEQMSAGPASSARVDGLHRAGWIVKDPRTVIPNGYVLVESGKIRDIGVYGLKTPVPAHVPIYDHGPGALIPALVNAHTHLELSCFKDRINCDKGFGPWVQELLQLREGSSPAEMIAGAKRGLGDILATGTGAVCEISSLGITDQIVSDSGLHGLWCRELLGNLTPAVHAQAEPGKLTGPAAASVAGHAPHTTSPALLRYLKQVTEARNVPFSIHLSESYAEMDFIGSGQGPWAEFLTSRGIDFSDWGLPARSPVVYLDSLGILNARTLAVHLLRADNADLDVLMQRRTNVCLCPRSNQALHGRLPNIPAMLARGICLCLGTDSLASTPSLDLFDEMAFIASHYESIDPTQILQMATVNGAAALGQTVTGTIDPGGAPHMVYVPVSCASEHQVVEALVNKRFNEPCEPLFSGACTNKLGTNHEPGATCI
jgi:cytosine/adenosine deaminase-related metal-dependent hydrolase